MTEPKPPKRNRTPVIRQGGFTPSDRRNFDDLLALNQIAKTESVVDRAVAVEALNGRGWDIRRVPDFRGRLDTTGVTTQLCFSKRLEVYREALEKLNANGWDIRKTPRDADFAAAAELIGGM